MRLYVFVTENVFPYLNIKIICSYENARPMFTTSEKDEDINYFNQYTKERRLTSNLYNLNNICK